MEFPKIESLYERDELTHKFKQPFVLKSQVYGLLKTWEFTEKIDGTNIRLSWSPAAECPESFHVGGRTDNAQIPADLVAHLYQLVSAEKMRAVFPDVDAIIYGEGYGAGIQKGGGYSQSKKFAAFDVLVDGKWWLDWQNVCDVAAKLGLETVPFVGEFSLEKGIDWVRGGFESAIHPMGAKPPMAEGLVGRPKETLFDKKGSRVIVKLKTKDF
mgnify:CR=1 FL=1